MKALVLLVLHSARRKSLHTLFTVGISAVKDNEDVMPYTMRE